jgi:hypothetical protein
MKIRANQRPFDNILAFWGLIQENLGQSRANDNFWLLGDLMMKIQVNRGPFNNFLVTCGPIDGYRDQSEAI